MDNSVELRKLSISNVTYNDYVDNEIDIVLANSYESRITRHKWNLINGI